MEELRTIQWPGWQTVRLIGRGSFGAVYEIERDLFGSKEKAALKHIGIPQNPSDIDEMYSDGYDDESITATFRAHLKSIVDEYTLMRKLNGSANIVNCDDVRYVEREGGRGWDIYIKMELLTPLTKALPDEIPEQTVRAVALDMCQALVLCRHFDIIHRDIKPQNIFVSPLGDYKLGDFGIAKTVEKTMGGTKTGTYKYMAPEVYNNQPYGHSADIYSLGIVLYWMLNKKRMPFVPLPPAKLNASMDEQARNRRLAGEPLPPPADGSEAFKAIVLKACAYNPGERYHTAQEMLDDLRSLGAEAAGNASVWMANGSPQSHAPAPSQSPPFAGKAPSVHTLATDEAEFPGRSADNAYEAPDATVSVFHTPAYIESQELSPTVSAFGANPAAGSRGNGAFNSASGFVQNDGKAFGTAGSGRADPSVDRAASAAWPPAQPRQPQPASPYPVQPPRRPVQPRQPQSVSPIPAQPPQPVTQTKKKSKTGLIAAIAGAVAVLAALVVLLIWKPWIDRSASISGDWNSAGSNEEGRTEPSNAGIENIGTGTIKPDDGNENPPAPTTDMKVAMITDYGDITDESFSQATYEGAKAWCEENNVPFTYYKPTGDSTEARVASIDQAVADGYNVLLMPGYAFAGAIVETVEMYPDVKYIALDVSEFDLQDAHGTADDFSWVYPSNLYSAVYQEELAGYMAGVAAVKLGYEKIGYLGGMAVPAVVRYGYGFVQGVNDAAKELGKVDKIEVKYVYGNMFYGDSDITAYMDTWYAAGTEVVFACGGGIYASAAEAAQKVNAKVIGVDVDQAPTIDSKYAEGMTVTSAMKGLAATVKAQLGKVRDGTFEGGKVENLGIVSENPEENFVQLPASTQWNEGFTVADYNALVAALLNREITVSDSIEAEPSVDIAVDYQGNIKG